MEKNKLFYKRVADLASKHACTPAQLALAWVLHQGNDIVPIPGSAIVTLVLLTTLFTYAYMTQSESYWFLNRGWGRFNLNYAIYSFK